MSTFDHIFDYALALERVAGKPAMAHQIFEMTIATLEADLDYINKAYAANNLELLRNHIHKIRGGLCYTGLPALEALTAKMDENLLREDTETLAGDMQELARLVAAVLQEAENIVLLLDPEGSTERN